MPPRVRVNLANPQELLEPPAMAPQGVEGIIRYRIAHGPSMRAAELGRIFRGGPAAAAVLEWTDFSPTDTTAPEDPAPEAESRGERGSAGRLAGGR
jgi:hypothetical protein